MCYIEVASPKLVWEEYIPIVPLVTVYSVFVITSLGMCRHENENSRFVGILRG